MGTSPHSKASTPKSRSSQNPINQTINQTQPPTRSLIGASLSSPNGFHVGTTKRFCLDYYTGMSDPHPNKIEVLLKLEINPDHLQKPEMIERWQWPCGTEAIVSNAKIIGITTIPPD